MYEPITSETASDIRTSHTEWIGIRHALDLGGRQWRNRVGPIDLTSSTQSGLGWPISSIFLPAAATTKVTPVVVSLWQAGVA